MEENKKILKIDLKNKSGITLLVLVITIVTLIILSTVTIDAVFGDNGLMDLAKGTQDKTSSKIDEESKKINQLFQEHANVMAEDSKSLPEGWDGTKVTPVESADKVIVPVPNGYTASSVASEKTVSGGFVIYEGTEAVIDSNVDTAKTTRNQFVWVPVDNINKMAKVTSGIDSNGRTNYQGKLYNFSTSGATEWTSYGQGSIRYMEPDVVKEYDGSDATVNASYFKTAISSTMTSGQFKTQLQEEFNEMVESVDTYGGFYIGRYETGNLASSVGIEPVVVKENNSISNVNWYYQYQNSKLIKANENVVSTMIWGSMWYRTLLWLVEENETTDGVNGKSYAEIKNSTNWGNYGNNTEEGAGSKQSTGYSENWKTNNIYDLAGNVFDWTIEAYGTNCRVIHGGSYDRSGSAYPASSRYYTGNPSASDSSYGSRSALYVALN